MAFANENLLSMRVFAGVRLIFLEFSLMSRFDLSVFLWSKCLLDGVLTAVPFLRLSAHWFESGGMNGEDDGFFPRGQLKCVANAFRNMNN